MRRYYTQPITEVWQPRMVPWYWWVALAWFTTLLLYVVFQMIVTLGRPDPPMLPVEGGTISVADRTTAAERVDRSRREAPVRGEKGDDAPSPLTRAIDFHKYVTEFALPSPSPTTPPSPQAPDESGLDWEALRECESGNNYRIDTGNGYYGAYQFNLSTWASYGPPGNPAQAPPAEQDRRAKALYAARGAQPWPVCGRLL